ncbi:hypothetical protein MANES_08G075865v8 [Manihot esculenta]|uniref:Uncharacterized protein n=1 Tax=Manihot esculenta TaxID=3983 RepID=A0ACB7H9X7_MANES|nr:hypothetical protein MANES_08G075865v8 [Manihot esculenta]
MLKSKIEIRTYFSFWFCVKKEPLIFSLFFSFFPAALSALPTVCMRPSSIPSGQGTAFFLPYPEVFLGFMLKSTFGAWLEREPSFYRKVPSLNRCSSFVCSLQMCSYPCRLWNSQSFALMLSFL